MKKEKKCYTHFQMVNCGRPLLGVLHILTGPFYWHSCHFAGISKRDYCTYDLHKHSWRGGKTSNNWWCNRFLKVVSYFVRVDFYWECSCFTEVKIEGELVRGLYVGAHIAQEEKLQPGGTTRNMAGEKCSHSVLVPNISGQQSVSRLNLPTVTPTAPFVPHFPTQMGCGWRKSRQWRRFSATVHLHSIKRSQTRCKLLMRTLTWLQNQLQSLQH